VSAPWQNVSSDLRLERLKTVEERIWCKAVCAHCLFR